MGSPKNFSSPNISKTNPGTPKFYLNFWKKVKECVIVQIYGKIYFADFTNKNAKTDIKILH